MSTVLHAGRIAALALSLPLVAATPPGAHRPYHSQVTMAFTLSSTAFTGGGAIPQVYTCEGKDIAPPLSWTGAPAATKAFALIADDPDAPDPKAPQMTWVHWVLYDVPVSVSSLAEGVTAATLPAEARDGLNGWKHAGYGGPCPPIGRHRYFFKLYALDASLGDLKRPDKAKLEQAMKSHVLAMAELIGTYEKQH